MSCELESVDYGSINTSIFPKNAKDAEALLNGSVYSVFSIEDGYSRMFSLDNGILIVPEMATDIAECAWRDRAHILNAEWSMSNMSRISSSNVTDYLKFIGTMMLNVERIKAIDMDETLKAQYIAQLQCGMGFLAYLFYDYYGPVVLPTLEALQNPQEGQIFPRATEDEMGKFIVDNLTAAASGDLLPYRYPKGDSDYGRMTKGVCHTVLMKYYMAVGQWAKAEAEGRELMKSEYGYKLMPHYKDIFTLENEQNEETIFSIVCLHGTDLYQGWHTDIFPSDYPVDQDQKWNGYRMAWDFYHTYDKDDERLQTIVAEYTGTSGVLHNETTDRGDNSKPLYYGVLPLKYEWDSQTTGEDSQIDYIIYRYADVLTLLSEAIVRNSNSVTQEAVNLLNTVRERSLPGKGYKVSDFTGVDDFLDKLLLERGHELYWEGGTRRQDLIRHGKWETVMAQKAGHAVDSHLRRFPLPQSWIDEGKGAVEQNPGY
jgi:hypothetical protein